MNTKQLEDFRNLLLRELSAAAESMRRDKTDVEEVEHANVILDEADLASRNHTRTVLNAVTEAHARRLRSIEQALVRIDRGDYGTCRRCEEGIDIKRLLAMPWATLCLQCQTEIEVFLLMRAPNRIAVFDTVES